MRWLAFVLLTVTAAAVCQDKNYKEVEAATHRIHVVDIYEPISRGHCSATSIAPHALLTAGHCIHNSSTVDVDDTPVGIDGVINDGHDHSIILTVGQAFDKYVKLRQREMVVSEEVFIIGNPDYVRSAYRRGPVSGITSDFGMKEYVLDLNGFYGDSGSGIFDSKGTLVGAVSTRRVLVTDNKDDVPATFLAAFVTRFTAEQIQAAEEFGPK